MDLMTIGAFAERTRLSPKALRLYDQLGLLPPEQIEPSNGYRFYSEEQVERAQLVGLLRRLEMPLSVIAETLAEPADQWPAAIGDWWAGIESAAVERRELVSYLQARLRGATMITPDVQMRTLPERRLLSISRHLHAGETDSFFDEAFARLRGAGSGLEGIAGCPFLVFYGEVSDDSDGPMELCRPVAADTVITPPGASTDLQLRTEAAHEEAYVRLSINEMSWPKMMPAVDAIERWVRAGSRQPAGPLRQVLFADQRTAAPDSLVCDLSVPLE